MPRLRASFRNISMTIDCGISRFCCGAIDNRVRVIVLIARTGCDEWLPRDRCSASHRERFIMIVTRYQIAIPGIILLVWGLLAGLTGPIALAEPPIGESMSPADSSFSLSKGNAASLVDVRSVTCQTYSPESFADAFCGVEPTGAYGGEFPAMERRLIAPAEGTVDNLRDFSYIQLDGNWASKEHARWRLPQVELKL